MTVVAQSWDCPTMAVVAQSSRTEPDAIVVAQSSDRARQDPAGKREGERSRETRNREREGNSDSTRVPPPANPRRLWLSSLLVRRPQHLRRPVRHPPPAANATATPAAQAPPLPDDAPTTVRFIRQRILPYIDDRLAVMEKEGVSLGGVSPFNPDAFSTHLGKDKVYECVVGLSAFSMFEFNYEKNPPTVGGIMRVREQIVPHLTSGNLTYDKGWQPQSLPVRVSSINALPLGNLVPLVSEEVRLALAWAWADAVSKKETAAATVYEDMARSIKVKFELEPDEDEGMLMKWTSAIKVSQ